MKRKYFIPGLLVLSLLAGCGSTASETSGSEKATTSNNPAESTKSEIVITDFAKRELHFKHSPKNIVALSSGDMNIIYSLGGTVVGRPTSHGDSPDAPYANVEQVGSTHEYDLEKIASLKPDLVIGNNPMNTKDIQAFEGIGSQMLLTSANSVAEIQKEITLYGDLLQKQDKATEINASITKKIEDYSKQNSKDKRRVLLIYGAPGTYMVALPNSLTGDILQSVGGENIAADYKALENYPQYAQLNVERIIEANPEYVFLITHGNPSEVKDGFTKEMAQNPAWNNIKAVKNNKIEILPSNLFGSNPGTQVVEALDYMNELLQSTN
ncbi:MAG: helical backbone metal receptor [Bacillaceae bacterium]